MLASSSIGHIHRLSTSGWEILRSADEAVMCRTADRLVAGFATAITDHRFAAYIPLVDVLPEHHGRRSRRDGKDRQRVLERLRACYMIDSCVMTTWCRSMSASVAPYSTLLPGGITTVSTPPTIDLSEMLGRCAVGQRGVSVARRYALSVSMGEVAPSGCS